MPRYIPKEDTKMNSSKNTRYTSWLNLTLAVSVATFICCLVGDIFGYSFCKFCFMNNFFTGSYLRTFSFLSDRNTRFYIFLTCFYLCTALVYPIIFCVIGLIRNIKKDKIFEKANTRLMSGIALCCFAICVICTLGAIASHVLAVVALIGLFVGLIVQCVRLVMDRAIDMRDELALTV